MSECIHAEEVMFNVKNHLRGYRRISLRGEWALCHRMVYEECFGDPGELMVLHKCDNRKCINPEHLFLGTAKDNMDDMVAKGRAWPGPRKITPEQAAEIRVASGTNAEIAASYGISAGQVGKIKRFEKWKRA